MGKHDQNHDSGHRFTDGVGRLHQAKRFATMLGAPGFGDERRAGGPFTAHTQTEQKAKNSELRNGMRKTTSGASNGIHEDGCHERARAPDAVSKDAEKKSPESRGNKRERAEEAGGALTHAEIADQISEDERVQHDVHGVEHPAESAGDQRFAFCGRNVPRPLEWRRTHGGVGWGGGVTRCHFALPLIFSCPDASRDRYFRRCAER